MANDSWHLEAKLYDDTYTFQHDSAPAGRSQRIVELMRSHTRDLIGSENCWKWLPNGWHLDWKLTVGEDDNNLFAFIISQTSNVSMKP